MKKIGLLTSGGDAPGMNAAIRSIVQTGFYFGIDVIGIERGYTGLLQQRFQFLDNDKIGNIIDKGGTVLKSSRCEEMKTEAGIYQAISILQKNGIDGLIVIGGDGSFQGAAKISAGNIKVVCLPGTIDNDLAYTEYSIGFDTAVNTVLESISRIRDTSISHEKATIIEVMGRNCGDIALYAGLAGGAEMIVLPEHGYCKEEVCAEVIRRRKAGDTHITLLLAEGCGSADLLRQDIMDTTGIDVRVTVLGFLQRGGSPTAFDRILASRMGHYAVDLLAHRKGNCAIGIKNNSLFNIDITSAINQKKEANDTLYTLTKILSR